MGCPVSEERRRHDDTVLDLILEKIEALDSKLSNHITEEDNKIGELVDAWNTSKHIVWFVKWLATIAAALALSWAWVHNHFTVGIK
jgi:hypothetical protein